MAVFKSSVTGIITLNAFPIIKIKISLTKTLTSSVLPLHMLTI